MIHRVVLGSIERFIGVITEHFAGAFPVWLSARAGQGAARHRPRASTMPNEVADKLNAQGIRVEVDARSEKIGKKIREATLGKVPYMLVVGDRDMENATVSVRTRGGEDLGAMSQEDFAARVLDDVKTKRIW